MEVKTEVKTVVDTKLKFISKNVQFIGKAAIAKDGSVVDVRNRPIQRCGNNLIINEKLNFPIVIGQSVISVNYYILNAFEMSGDFLTVDLAGNVRNESIINPLPKFEKFENSDELSFIRYKDSTIFKYGDSLTENCVYYNGEMIVALPYLIRRRDEVKKVNIEYNRTPVRCTEMKRYMVTGNALMMTYDTKASLLIYKFEGRKFKVIDTLTYNNVNEIWKFQLYFLFNVNNDVIMVNEVKEIITLKNKNIRSVSFDYVLFTDGTLMDENFEISNASLIQESMMNFVGINNEKRFKMERTIYEIKSTQITVPIQNQGPNQNINQNQNPNQGSNQDQGQIQNQRII